MKSDLVKKFDLIVSGPQWIVPLKQRKLEAQRIVAPAGTDVICPGCRACIGTLNSNVYSGVDISALQVDFKANQRRKSNEKAVCTKCATAYMRVPLVKGKSGTLEIHTELGWI